MCQLLIKLPFSRLQHRGEHGLAFIQQIAQVLSVVHGPYVSAHNLSPALELSFVICPSGSP